MTRATNNSAMREQNLRLVLETIRRHPASRSYIANKIGLTRASVTYITDALIQEGLISESATVSGGKGRNPVPLHVNYAARRFLGVNMLREGIVAGIVDLGGETLFKTNMEYSGEEPSVQLAKLFSRLEREAGGVTSIGICSPGPLDYRRGVILNPPRFDAWHGFPIADFFSERAGCPAYLDNVANAAALEEMYFGLGNDLENFIVLLVISGIGAGIVMDRNLLRGVRGLGNEIGHCSIDRGGRECACGNRGCLERYASIPTILEGTRFSTWYEAANDAAPDAVELVEREAEYLSVAMINVVNTLDIDHIILKGDIAPNAGRVCEIMQEKLLAGSITLNHSKTLRVEANPASDFVRAASMPAIHAFYKGGLN